MRRIDTTQVTDPSVLQPFTTRSLDFLQKNIIDYNQSTNVAFNLKRSQSSLNPFIITGLEKTGNSITDGQFTFGGFAGEYIFEAIGNSNTSGWAGETLVPTIFYATDTNGFSNSLADPLTFSDLTSKSVHYTVKYVLTNTASLATSVTLPGGFTLNSIAFSTVDAYLRYNSSIQSNITGSTWTGGAIKYGIFNGNLELAGTISHTGAATTTLGLPALLTRYRPLSAKVFSVTVKDDSNFIPGYIKISTAGVITLECTFTGSSSQSVSFDNLRTPMLYNNNGGGGW